MNMYSIDLIKKEELFLNPWGINSDTLSELDYQLYLKNPKLILECGSGVSTLFLGKFCEAAESRIISLEHDEKYYNKTLNLLKEHNLEKYVDLYLCPLVGNPPVYDFNFEELNNQKIDFVLIDGPPEGTGGRANIFPWLLEYLNDNWEIWLDDGNREQESNAIINWKNIIDFNINDTKLDKDIKILTQNNFINHKLDISDIVISVLSGSRPNLLKQTLESLPFYILSNPENIIGFCNGGDKPTLQIFESFNIQPIITNKILFIGDAISFLSNYVKMLNKTYWLHLEDDWLFKTEDKTWLNKSKELLEYCNQVRLRKYSEKVLTTNMVTKELINWDLTQYGFISNNVHFTFNPSLIKCKDIDLIFPCKHEIECAKKAIENKFVTYQLYPGCFKHIGDTDSLRQKVKVSKFGDQKNIKLDSQDEFLKNINTEKILFDKNYTKLSQSNFSNQDYLVNCQVNIKNILTYLKELKE